jgi:hypothetical protein
LDFPSYDFSVIYYDFSKLFQGVIPVLESSGGKRSIFIGWWVMCSNPHRLGGKVDFFLSSLGGTTILISSKQSDQVNQMPWDVYLSFCYLTVVV